MTKNFPKKPSFIAVEGCIGVGKTTLCEALARRLNAKTLFEQVEENPFLEDFYKDVDAYAFRTQIFFLLSRYKQQEALGQRELFDQTVVADYCIAKDRIFAQMNLSKAELGLYDQLFETLFRHVQVPDLIVYLRAPLDVIKARIKQRARPFEKEIEDAYLSRLMASYDQFFATFSICPVLVVETQELNFPSREGDLNYVMDAIGEVMHHKKSKHLVTASDKEQPNLFG